MHRIASVVVGLVIALGIVGSTAAPGWAAAPPDKPVVSITDMKVWASGGASPDTWRHYVDLSVYGFNFTPGGNVYITFQDVTAGTRALPNGEWVVAGNGPCGPECSNWGKVRYSRTLNFEYGSVCGHYLRVWAWDEVKSPRAGYGWSFADRRVAC